MFILTKSTKTYQLLIFTINYGMLLQHHAAEKNFCFSQGIWNDTSLADSLLNKWPTRHTL